MSSLENVLIAAATDAKMTLQASSTVCQEGHTSDPSDCAKTFEVLLTIYDAVFYTFLPKARLPGTLPTFNVQLFFASLNGKELQGVRGCNLCNLSHRHLKRETRQGLKCEI